MNIRRARINARDYIDFMNSLEALESGLWRNQSQHVVCFLELGFDAVK